MEAFENSLAFWSSILGTAIALLGFVNSSRWLAVLGLFLIAASVAALLYIERQRQRLKRASIKIEGRSIDSLNVASLGRRLNRSLVVQEVNQIAIITGEDMTMTWRYRGYCWASRETVIEFSIDTDNHIPFYQLDCFAYDLQRDPKRRHPIRPILLSADGLSKKIAVPLLEPLAAEQPFDVLLSCTLPGCMKNGIEYYTSTLSVAEERVRKSTVRLVFLRNRPSWVRVYECDRAGATKLLKDIRPSRATAQRIEYTDLATDVSAQSARIYLFRRTGDSLKRTVTRQSVV